jgi:hypothetical protein
MDVLEKSEKFGGKDVRDVIGSIPCSGMAGGSVPRCLLVIGRKLTVDPSLISAEGWSQP